MHRAQVLRLMTSAKYCSYEGMAGKELGSEGVGGVPVRHPLLTSGGYRVQY
jgi:hypothetical protein